MARQNTVWLYGLIEKRPTIKRKDDGEFEFANFYLHVVRGVRESHDGIRYMKHDHPLIISMAPKTIEKISELKENDIVMIKGTVSTKGAQKKSSCQNCTDENGKPTVNMGKGLYTYVTPIFVKKIKECPDYETALTEIIKARELSNQVVVTGNLWNDPKYFLTKKGTLIAQYQLVTERKFRVEGDSPDNKADWPWVKSYGDQAIEDRMRLVKNSTIIVDGFLQERKVIRKTKCKCCGLIYPWKDRTMEIVPFETEYVKDYKTDAMLESESGQKAEDIRNALFKHLIKDELTEDMNTDDLNN